MNRRESLKLGIAALVAPLLKLKPKEDDGYAELKKKANALDSLKLMDEKREEDLLERIEFRQQVGDLDVNKPIWKAACLFCSRRYDKIEEPYDYAEWGCVVDERMIWRRIFAYDSIPISYPEYVCSHYDGPPYGAQAMNELAKDANSKWCESSPDVAKWYKV